ncbi:MAG TPA: S-adenosylmethionine:tRNA ribosyltransferase-isomerase [Haliangiales bacterium]|nr:S-adenosylmethionine:tRNA ribosyltransferase-isomerase [Haliangiales bacterium]
MNAAAWPREDPLRERLLHIDRAGGAPRDLRMDDLPRLVGPGDLLVVNDAATLPASFRFPGGELRLAQRLPDGTWLAVTFGPGDWRTRTEDRPPPPPVAAGDRLPLGPDLVAEVLEVRRPRLVRIAFDKTGAALWRALYRLGRPVQYAHVAGPLELWHVQTGFAARPWAVEEPSAGRPLTAGLLDALRRRGAEIGAVTHAAGLSSTGDAELDALLPLPEAYEVPTATAAALERAGRVLAVGTTVVRALESYAATGARAGMTDLLVDGRHRLRAVHGVLTGTHEPGTSHFRLLEAFAPRATLLAAHAHAVAAGYLAHEFGDSVLIV